MAAIDLAALGVAVGCAAKLCRARGYGRARGLLILLVPALWSSMAILFSEPVVVELILLTYFLALEGRERAATATGATLLLAREVAGLALVPLLFERRDGERGHRSGVGCWRECHYSPGGHG